MKNKSHNQAGFTLIEMLITVLVIVILLAVSIAGITTYIRKLRLAELDNAAKQIYLAAQNRAILLEGGQRLEKYVVKEDKSNEMEYIDVIPNSSETTQITAYYIHCTDDVIKQLLPKETIESSLWDGDFYIIYEPKSGSVIDTFFSKEELPVEGAFRSFYEKWRAAEQKKRMNHKPMIGYYGGEAAESGKTMSLRTPVVNIYNEDALRAEVIYWVPRLLHTMGEGSNIDLEVKLAYKDKTIILNKDDAKKDMNPELSYISYTFTWVLDSLEEGKQFKDLIADDSIKLGDDFSINAMVSYAGDFQINGAQKTVIDNSLFAKDSGKESAVIEYMRHLQNLDVDFSNVSSEKTSALQIKDIHSVKGYDFRPINNDFLQSYDGDEFKIYDLTIKSTSNKPSGLFSEINGTAKNNKTLKDIKLVDANVVNSSYATGTLVGEAEYINITGCQIYWENRFEQTTNLREVLGDSSKGFHYKVISDVQAGGLAGVLRNAVIDNSLASTLVKGNTAAIGGLVGEAEDITIHNSYSASYLKGTYASGLIGKISGTAKISNSYAVGFIDSLEGGEAAGLCLGKGKATVKNSYSAMLFTSENVKNYPLCQTKGSYNKVYYLESDLFHFSRKDEKYKISYKELTDFNKWNKLFDAGIFEQKSIMYSHPYNLQTTLSLNEFIYPGLKGMEHWGDWGAQFQNGSLVYYEQYIHENGTYSYGLSGGGIDCLKESTISKDGYGVAYKGTDFISGIDVTLHITDQDSASSQKTESITYKASDMLEVNGVNDRTGEMESYYILPLPEYLVNSQYAAADFYHKITIAKDESEVSYYYNPHFADAILPYHENTELENVAKGLYVKIRTPRHLFYLSKFDAYYSSYHQYHFIQQMDLDYSLYSGYNLFPEKIGVQEPIGISSYKPFRNNYYGNCHIIKGLKIDSKDSDNNNYQYIGLFGYNVGVLKDVVYFMDETTKISVIQTGGNHKDTYIGGLTGYNGGTIENSAIAGVEIKADCYDYSTIYIGAMAGANQGTIVRSSAETTGIDTSATMSNAYVGGFIGINYIGGIIEQSYSVGHVFASRARYGEVIVTGFAARNEGSIVKNYCAVSIDSDGGAQIFGFSKDSSIDCVYLNDGNFVFNDINYTAQYKDSFAKPINWNLFTGVSESEDMKKLGMSYHASAYGNDTTLYPYPGVVLDGNQKLIHYGKWPNIMNLGDMGVYYWEKTEKGVEVSYHFSMLSVDLKQNVISKESTLSTAHDNDSVITEYGYGFFHANEISPFISSSGIGYEKDLEFSFDAANENTEVNESLSKLVLGKYTFHSYNTWNTKKSDSSNGLYLKAETQQNQSEPPFGIWTLMWEGYHISFKINPFFADSMSYSKPNDGGIAAKESVPVSTVGSNPDNPYQIRSIKQLQFINWNVQEMNTVTSIKNASQIVNASQININEEMMASDAENMEETVTDHGNEVTVPLYENNTPRAVQGNEDEFMFLSYVDTNTKSIIHRSYYWLQTHDLNGKAVDYRPIAALEDTVVGDGIQESWAYGWFGGSYNGNDYKVQDVTISTEGINTTGLFGFTLDAELKNIILYSSNGDTTITATNNRDNWYAIGGLVGLAANTEGSSRTIENCAVAGYLIFDQNKNCAYGGGGVGGLVGICNMELKNCTAVTNININFTHSNKDRNVRVGGIAGSCQQNITQCYAGGEITVAQDLKNKESNVHLGGIVGGYFMKPLTITDDIRISSDESKQSKIKNCYSYMALPDENNINVNSKIFVIGGRGEILNSEGTFLCTYENCYYLAESIGNIVHKDRILDLGQTRSCSYEELSRGGSVFHEFITTYGFQTISTEASSGVPIDGRYSFGISDYLLGANYPFPTILTQNSTLVSEGKANVHYGNWRFVGIKRQYGALPVSIDLFADYSEERGTAVWSEELSLSNVSAGGTWQAESMDKDVADVELISTELNTQRLNVIAKKQGNTKIVITYTVDGKTYTRNLDVHISANLRILPDEIPVVVYVNEMATIDLKFKDADGNDIEKLLMNLKLNDISVEYDFDKIDGADISCDSGISLSVNSKNKTGFTQITMRYEYEYNGQSYSDSSVISLKILQPAVVLNPITVSFGENDKQMIYSYSSDNIEIKVDGDRITDISIIDFEIIPEYKQFVWAEWDKNASDPTVLLELNSPAIPEMVVGIRMQFRFYYGGAIHTMWQNQQINLKKVK